MSLVGTDLQMALTQMASPARRGGQEGKAEGDYSLGRGPGMSPVPP